jgi:hypothetical protein
MLAGPPVAPPQLDAFFCAGDAHHRAQDLAELGFNEAESWGASAPKRADGRGPEAVAERQNLVAIVEDHAADEALRVHSGEE